MPHNMAEMWKLHTFRLYYVWNVICVVVHHSFCCMLTHIRWLGKELGARCDPMGFRTTDTNSCTSSSDRSSSLVVAVLVLWFILTHKILLSDILIQFLIYLCKFWVLCMSIICICFLFLGFLSQYFLSGRLVPWGSIIND